MTTRLIALVPAAGTGSRAARADAPPKQYRELAGQPMLRHTVRALLDEPRISQVRVAVAAGDPWVAGALAGLPRTLWRPCGGPTRADTVRQALEDAGLADDDWVLVHDAARPGLPAAALRRLIDTCLRWQRGGLLALPVADTVKRAQAGEGDDSGAHAPEGPPAVVQDTLSRAGLWLAQTPQMFRAGELARALQASRGDPQVTDEASAIERFAAASGRPLLVLGDPANVKLTWLADFAQYDAALRGRAPVGASPQARAPEAQAASGPRWRIGQGNDVHRLVAGRPLILGGVCIPFDKGLEGHSDGDALLHAITDAVLGAAGLGDIGRHFSDRDPRWAGADSRHFLRVAIEQITQAGWQVVNVDATVHAQAPRIGPHAPAMVETIAGLLCVAVGQVNVKAKTNEGLGYLGRGEGIAASAVALLARR